MDYSIIKIKDVEHKISFEPSIPLELELELKSLQISLDSIRSSPEISDEEWDGYSDSDDILESIDINEAKKRVKIVDGEIPYDYTKEEYEKTIDHKDFCDARYQLYFEKMEKWRSLKDETGASYSSIMETLNKEYDEKLAKLKEKYNEQ